MKIETLDYSKFISFSNKLDNQSGDTKVTQPMGFLFKYLILFIKI